MKVEITSGLTGTAQRYRIRRLFLMPRPSYSMREAARIVGMTPKAFAVLVETGTYEYTRHDDAIRFRWVQLARLAMDQRSLADVYDALGEQARDILPPMLALRTVTFQLPEYVYRALYIVAAQNGQSIDDRLYAELRAFAERHIEKLNEIHPGYRRACVFPEKVE